MEALAVVQEVVVFPIATVEDQSVSALDSVDKEEPAVVPAAYAVVPEPASSMDDLDHIDSAHSLLIPPLPFPATFIWRLYLPIIE